MNPQDLDIIPHPELDLALVKAPTNPTAGPYPKFRSTELEVGEMLCRSGFPFKEIELSWDENTDQFHFPGNPFPVPMFANEGIISRFMESATNSDHVVIETSSPGLRGQSGGPLFDTNGSLALTVTGRGGLR